MYFQCATFFEGEMIVQVYSLVEFFAVRMVSDVIDVANVDDAELRGGLQWSRQRL